MFSPKFKVIFCGTPEFALPCLTLLHQHPLIEIKAVITMPDRPAGRGQLIKSPPVAEFAKKHQLNLIQTENLNHEQELLSTFENQIDLIIVLAFAQFLNKKWLSLPKHGCFNIHTSLLPKYRGAAPIQYALLNGDLKTGVSIQKMVSKMDAGNIVHEMEIPIRPFENTASLQTKLQFAAAQALENFLILFSQNKLVEKVQDETLVSFAPEISKELGHIHFHLEARNTIFNKLRGLSPWPGLYFFINNKRIKIYDLEIPTPENLFSINAGEIKAIHQQLIVGCLDGPLRITSLQLEGKEKTSDQQFICGIKETLTITSQGNIK